LRIQPVDATQWKLREQRECCIDRLNPQSISVDRLAQTDTERRPQSMSTGIEVRAFFLRRRLAAVEASNQGGGDGHVAWPRSARHMVDATTDQMYRSLS
jgi:hypothetical protein